MIFVTSTRCVESKGVIRQQRYRRGSCHIHFNVSNDPNIAITYPIFMAERGARKITSPNIELSNLDWVNYDGLPGTTGIP